MKGQLRISRPAQRMPTMRRLSRRQRELLVWLRTGPQTTATVARLFGYADAGAACQRLVKRGLVRRVRRGTYAAVVLRERSAYDGRDGDGSAD